MKIAALVSAVMGASIVSAALPQAAVAQSFLDQPLTCQATFDPKVIDAGATKPLLAVVAQTRTAARALGFGGVGQYAVLPGRAAQLRLSASPAFLVAAPSNMQLQGLVTLAKFEARKNNTREVVVGGGYMSYSSGIHPDRIIATTVAAAASQAGAPAGMTIYEVKPAGELPTGEYALIVATGAQPAAGFAGIPGTFYDFGVD